MTPLDYHNAETFHARFDAMPVARLQTDDVLHGLEQHWQFERPPCLSKKFWQWTYYSTTANIDGAAIVTLLRRIPWISRSRCLPVEVMTIARMQLEIEEAVLAHSRRHIPISSIPASATCVRRNLNDYECTECGKIVMPHSSHPAIERHCCQGPARKVGSLRPEEIRFLRNAICRNQRRIDFERDSLRAANRARIARTAILASISEYDKIIRL